MKDKPIVLRVVLEYSPERHRVFVRGVWPEGAPLPDILKPTHTQNIVSVFQGVDMKWGTGFTLSTDEEIEDMEIYVVVAKAGWSIGREESSRVVCSYRDQARAEEHARRARLRWERLRLAESFWLTRCVGQPTTYFNRHGVPRPGANPYDPACDDWTYRYIWYDVVATTLDVNV